MDAPESEPAVVTVCNVCGRERGAKELFGDPCKRDGCKGTLNQHEDTLHLQIQHLQGIADRRAAGTPAPAPTPAKPAAAPKKEKGK